MKKFKKILNKIIILMIVILCVMIGITTYNTSNAAGRLNNLGGSVYITRNPYVLLELENVYCAEHGTKIENMDTQYKVSDERRVTDPLFQYILNLPDEGKQIGTYWKENIKQNLIWWYLKNCWSTDVGFIHDAGLCHDHYFGEEYGTMSYDTLKSEINNATRAANNANNTVANISITEQNSDDDNIIIYVDIKDCDVYSVYYKKNNADDTWTCFNTSYNNSRQIWIPKENFDDINNAHIKVEGEKLETVNVPVIRVLTNDTYQKLICITDIEEETKTITATDEVVYRGTRNTDQKKTYLFKNL